MPRHRRRRGRADRNPYWNNAAEAEIAFAVGAVVCFADPPDRNLQSVRKVLSDSALRSAMIDVCRASGLWHGILARWANRSAQLRDKQLDSVLATANSHTRFLDTVSVLKNTRAGNFDPADLLDGTTTVYLVLPPEHVKSQAGLLRLWVGTLLRTVMKGGLDSYRKVQFLPDEASSLGPMDVLQQALDVGRGYGIRLIFLYQSVSQLRGCWPEGGDQNLLANTSQVLFAVNDLPMAVYVSNRLGETTITVGTGGTGWSGNHHAAHRRDTHRGDSHAAVRGNRPGDHGPRPARPVRPVRRDRPVRPRGDEALEQVRQRREHPPGGEGRLQDDGEGRRPGLPGPLFQTLTNHPPAGPPCPAPPRTTQETTVETAGLCLPIFAGIWVISFALFAAAKGLNKLWTFFLVNVLGQDPCRLDAKALDFMVEECVHISFGTASPVVPQTPNDFAPSEPTPPPPQGQQPQAPPVATALAEQQIEWHRQQLVEAYREVIGRRVEKLFPA